MKLFLLGATGGIGSEVIPRALDRGHQVTAFVRSPHKITLRHPSLTVIAGDPLNEHEIARNLDGHDAVLSAFGPPTLGRTTMRRDFGRGLASAMESAGVSRVLLVSNAFLFREGIPLIVLGGTVFRNVRRDSGEMEREIMRDELAWTILRPPRLTNGPSLACRISDGRNPTGGLIVTRAAVAEFMVKEVSAGQHVRQIVGIAR